MARELFTLRGRYAAVDEPLPCFGLPLQVHGRVAAHLKRPPISFGQRMNDTVGKTAVADWRGIELNNLVGRLI